jgi:hypothetical protein
MRTRTIRSRIMQSAWPSKGDTTDEVMSWLRLMFDSKRVDAAAKDGRFHVYYHRGSASYHGEGYNWSSAALALVGDMESINDAARAEKSRPERVFIKQDVAAYIAQRLVVIQSECREDHLPALREETGHSQVDGKGEAQNRRYGAFDALMDLVNEFGL